ncbi:MAG: 50S ribosomal protein L13 [Candidatus Eisenbacteria bacterium]|nr:50S ribosomal protein L13 [Candidatus Eisenbacteria bacterium]
MQTYATKASDVQTRRWFLIDANGQVLGRMASEAACLLRGKWNPMYVPYLDSGDHVLIVNASKVKLTGKKLEKKTYFHHTGYPGGGRVRLMSQRMKDRPEEVVRDAIWGMLPKGPLGRQMIRKLRIYADEAGLKKHEAQKLIPITLGSHGKAIPAAVAAAGHAPVAPRPAAVKKAAPAAAGKATAAKKADAPKSSAPKATAAKAAAAGTKAPAKKAAPKAGRETK